MTLNARLITEYGEPKFAVLPFDAYQLVATELAGLDISADFPIMFIS